MHYYRDRNGLDMDRPSQRKWDPPVCSVDGCDTLAHCKGMCKLHYERDRKGSVNMTKKKRRTFDYGEWYIDTSTGYVRATLSPGNKVYQHRVVMAEMIGRELLPHETPHHKNGDRADNRPENLELWSKSQPAGQRAIDKLEWAREIIALYSPLEQEGLI